MTRLEEIAWLVGSCRREISPQTRGRFDRWLVALKATDDELGGYVVFAFAKSGRQMSLRGPIAKPSLSVQYSDAVKCGWRQFPESSGCYAFFTDGESVRVGQAMNLRRRLSTYKASTESECARLFRWWLSESGASTIVSAWECTNLDAFERRLIKKLSPKFNVQGVPKESSNG